MILEYSGLTIPQVFAAVMRRKMQLLLSPSRTTGKVWDK